MSRKLQYGLLLLAALCVCWLVFGWWLGSYTELNQTTGLATQTPATQTPAMPDDQAQAQLPQHTTETQNNSQTPPEGWQDDWLSQLAERRYSQDTAVELTALAMEYESCGNRDMFWRFKGLQMTEEQNQIKSAVEKHCAELLSSYPLLENNQIKNGIQLVFNTYPASSPLGKLFQRQANQNSRLDIQQFMSELIPLSIQANNSQTLIMAEWVGGFGNRKLTFDPNMINSQNHDYLNTLQSIALTALSCEYQNGLTCSPTSRFMQEKCFTNQQFCGQTFSQWYDLAVTPGMAKDLEKLKQHYLNQAPLSKD